VPTPSPAPAGPRSLFGPRGRLPSWAQWTISLGLAGFVVAALVVFVDRAQPTANEPASVTRHSAVVEQNREARLLVAEDEEPHVLRIARPTPPRVAIRLAVAALMRAELRVGLISGPFQRATCRPRAGRPPTRAAFTCTAEAANVNYLLAGVVDPARRRVTICKRDLPPIPGLDVPLSRRCT
jgi:hypothetical protein